MAGRGDYCTRICVEAGAVLPWSKSHVYGGYFWRRRRGPLTFPCKTGLFLEPCREPRWRHRLPVTPYRVLALSQSSSGPILGGQNKLQLNETIALHLESDGRDFLATDIRTDRIIISFACGIRQNLLGGHSSFTVGVPICSRRVWTQVQVKVFLLLRETMDN